MIRGSLTLYHNIARISYVIIMVSLSLQNAETTLGTHLHLLGSVVIQILYAHVEILTLAGWYSGWGQRPRTLLGGSSWGRRLRALLGGSSWGRRLRALLGGGGGGVV